MAVVRPLPEVTSNLLPVPQIKESHDCAVDVARVGTQASVVAPPYKAMSVGDEVTFTMERYFDDGVRWEDFVRRKTLTDLDIGQPLQWMVQANELESIEGGSASMSYSVVYANPTVPTLSHTQALRIVTWQTDLMPAPRIKDFTGDMLDPEAHPNGITVVIDVYPGIEVGDEVVLYAWGDPREIKTLRVDPSTVDSGVLEVRVDHEWLSANNGKPIELVYQYARVGSAGTSEPLQLTLRRPLYLPLANIEGVIRDGDDEDNRGYLSAANIKGGVYISLPDEAVIGSGDKVQMHWEGYGNSGSHIADPMTTNPKRFHIPPQFVPANMGKRLNVFYTVTPLGEEPYTSKIFDLEIKDMVSGWPTLQIDSPASPGNQISLRTVEDEVIFRLGSWSYMKPDQRVRIYAKGVLAGGGEDTFDLREGDAELVTAEEYNEERIFASLPRTFLEKLQLNVQFDVIVETSFDDGNTYKPFPRISPKLVA
ncbi:hypothetical protein [Pseudomonas sp. OA65]|uniref:hypothetical protein n=1 Tax=Pseudomonas sp. OA65 TaxID=2818431 RepID=UPI001A9E4B2B|nr:hypothetical protein [Pseudomonas sp. OA65]MBO1542165.1 hypothetical protein [Pseudomonas sp. OA65]